MPPSCKEVEVRLRALELRTGGKFDEYVAHLVTMQKHISGNVEAEVLDLLGQALTDILRPNSPHLPQLKNFLHKASCARFPGVAGVQIADVHQVVNADRIAVAEIKDIVDKFSKGSSHKGLYKIMGALGRHHVATAQSYFGGNICRWSIAAGHRFACPPA